MSDEKKTDLTPEETKVVEKPKTEDTPSTPSVEELIKERDSLLAQNENLKGTQSAQSKTLNEYKIQVEDFSKNGVTQEALKDLQGKHDKLEKDNLRRSLLLEVASTKNIPSKALKFISGNTKEEIEASISEFISFTNTEKKTIPKDFSKVEAKVVDVKSEAQAFVKNAKLIKS